MRGHLTNEARMLSQAKNEKDSLNTHNFPLMDEVGEALVEAVEDSGAVEDFSGEATEGEQPLEKVGVSDGD